MSEYSKIGADVVNYKGRLNLSPTQTPEGWGYPGADTMRFNRLFYLGGLYGYMGGCFTRCYNRCSFVGYFNRIKE